MNNNSFVFYESFQKQMDTLHSRGRYEEELALYRALAEFGLYGVLPPQEDDIYLFGFEQMVTSIASAKERYIFAKKAGAKGGRKAVETDLTIEQIDQLKEELGTWDKVAEHLDMSTPTLRRIRDEKKSDGKEIFEKNPNVNVNDNVNEDVNDDVDRNDYANMNDYINAKYKVKENKNNNVDVLTTTFPSKISKWG